MKKKQADPKNTGFLLGYDVRWIKNNPDHPDYEKVKKEAMKKKIW